MRRRKPSGFTLIELMIVIFVIGIIGVILVIGAMFLFGSRLQAPDCHEQKLSNGQICLVCPNLNPAIAPRVSCPGAAPTSP